MENLTVAANATTINESTASLALSSTFLFLSAIIPIYFGSFRSLKRYIDGYSHEEEFISTRDAMKFPLVASCALFTIYLVIKFVPKHIVNMILMGLFTCSAILSLLRICVPALRAYMPKIFTNYIYRFKLTELEDTTETPEKKEVILDTNEFEIQTRDFPVVALCLASGVVYLWTGHWMANNVFGFAFALTAMEFLHLNRFVNGFILLGGLFVYDIFWVFFTDVMISVAKNIDAPIKIVFPRDIFEAGFFSQRHSMLGLGDIVIPGVFVAMLLRFDNKLNATTSKHFYFKLGMFAYALGLLTTFAAMFWFKHGQPALLYLSPACTGFPVIAALCRGEFKAMLDYSDCSEEEMEQIKNKAAKKTE